MYIDRHLEEQILDASRYYPVIMVCGQRQVGKSTMLNHIKEPNRRYVTLDDGNARRIAENDPSLFFETYGYPLLIDEFQRVPSILLEMKKIVDQKALAGEDNNGMFWLTGSQKFEMMKGVSESLAGRVAIFDMASLSTAEIEARPAALFHPDLGSIRERLKQSKPKNIHQVYEDIFRGGMPKLRATDLDRDRYYMDYINTYIERDIKDLAQVGKLNAFYDFLVFMAARTSQELKYEEIANAIVELARNPKLCLQMGENGFRRVEKKFQLEDMRHTYVQIYQDFAEKLQRPWTEKTFQIERRKKRGWNWHKTK